MTTLFRFASIATLVLTGLTIVPEIAHAKAEPSQSTDFLSDTVFKGYEPPCPPKGGGPDTTQGSGSR